MTEQYFFTEHDEAGKRIDSFDDLMTFNQMIDALANCEKIEIDGLPFWQTCEGVVISPVLEEV